jgi:ATP-dependent Lon protease
MLEVLDPAQNKNFTDHYIECEYDLSKVMFVMTANDIGRIPGPLRDRMEIINIPGYTPHEKQQIAKNYLVKRATENHGLKEYPVTVKDNVLMHIIRGYTKEAGVRNLERHMNTIARKIATDVVSNDVEKGKKYNVTIKQAEKYLGPVRFDSSSIEEEPQVGLVNGLAWTSVGGELLNIEVVTVPGNGKIQVTGKLGEVMQESAKAALSYVRSISDRLGVDHDWYNKNDIHIHVPDGATPKDGPSAGITMATALTSAIANIPVRQDVAMTGEISLRGRVMPIGGLKEKLLAAKQAGVQTVIIPKKNEKDLVKVPDEIKNGIDVHPVSEAEMVLKIALDLKKPEDFMKERVFTVLDGESDDSQQQVAN